MSLNSKQQDLTEASLEETIIEIAKLAKDRGEVIAIVSTHIYVLGGETVELELIDETSKQLKDAETLRSQTHGFLRKGPRIKGPSNFKPGKWREIEEEKEAKKDA